MHRKASSCSQLRFKKKSPDGAKSQVISCVLYSGNDKVPPSPENYSFRFW